MNRSRAATGACLALVAWLASARELAAQAQSRRPAAPPPATATAAGVSSEPLAGFDAYVAKGMSEWRVPGLAIAIVRNDSVVLAKGYGVRTLGKPDLVDERTLFAIASDTKAFTGMLLAMLADSGRVRWDDRVTSYLPGLQLADPYVTRELTVRDLLTHRSGLARADLLWAGGSPYSGEELLRRLRYLKPSWSLRSHYGYNNLMFVAAGQVAAAAAGRPWTELLRARILTPLGMSETNTSVTLLPALQNVATPHARVDGVVRTVPYTNADNIAAAGAINSNVADMAKWVRFQLDSGRVGGRRLVSVRNFRETRTPQTVIRLDSAYRALNPFTHLRSYAFGWNVSDYRGREMLSHAGNLSGMSAMVGLLPEERLGVVVLSNMEGQALRESLMYRVFDMYLGAPPKDWSAETLVQQRDNERQDSVREAKIAAARVQGTRPSLALDAYAGNYLDSLYGSANVALQNGKLAFTMAPNAVGDMEHWNYDTFRVTWRDHRDGKSFVTFVLDRSGKVELLRVEPEPGEPVEQVPRFTRVK